jgi:hypothetical protein
MKLIRTEHDKGNVNRALNTRNGPAAFDVLCLPLNSEVLVWREKGGWKGPYKISSIEGRDIILDLGNGLVKFRWTHIKPYHRDDDSTDLTTQEYDAPVEAHCEAPPVKRRGRPRKNPKLSTSKPQKDIESTPKSYDGQANESTDDDYTPDTSTRCQTRAQKAREVIVEHSLLAQKTEDQFITAIDSQFLTQKESNDLELSLKLRAEGIITTPGTPFEESDRTEMEALIANGIFEIQRLDPHKHSGRIFNLRLVREVKGKTTQPYEKSRLVFAGHSDTGKELILTQSPTIQRMSQRLLLALGASLQAAYGMKFELRDITQAYIQSKDKLTCDLYARPPKELRNKFPPDTVFKIVRPLYGAAESGLYWYKTYHNHHTGKLRMKVSTYNPCLLITDKGPSTFGLTGLQTDDTLSIVSDAFSEREETELKKAELRAKNKTALVDNNPIEFNGGKISLSKSNVVLTQKGQSKGLRTIDPEHREAAQQYIEQRV